VAIAMKEPHYDRITTTIEREWLAQIIAGTKKIEYRQIKRYWTKRFANGAIRTAAVERDESASAGSDRADPQDHPAWARVPIAFQEGAELQALGQTAAEAETVIISSALQPID
jgi:hypothetical protein